MASGVAGRGVQGFGVHEPDSTDTCPESDPQGLRSSYVEVIINCATTASASTSGSLPPMPGRPIGQVIRASTAAGMPRDSK